MEQLLQPFQPYTFKWDLVGSTAINGKGEDIDIALRVEEVYRPNVEALARNLRLEDNNHGYADDKEGMNNFHSYKRDGVNLLFCYEDDSYDRFVKGKDACIFLKNLGVDMNSKEVRVAIHALMATQDVEAAMKDVEKVKNR